MTCVFLLNNGKSDQLVVTLPETWQRLTKPQQQKTLNQASDCGSMQWCSRLWGKFCKHGQSNRGSRLSRMPYPAGQIQAKVKCPTRISRLTNVQRSFVDYVTNKKQVRGQGVPRPYRCATGASLHQAKPHIHGARAEIFQLSLFRCVRRRPLETGWPHTHTPPQRGH